MKPALLIVVLSLTLMPLASLADTPSGNETARGGATGFAIPTFRCLGLYWSPPGGTADKVVLVRYRAKGSSAWKEGLPMRYHPIAETDEDLTDYRGSIVHLTPGTFYEISVAFLNSCSVHPHHMFTMPSEASRIDCQKAGSSS